LEVYHIKRVLIVFVMAAILLGGCKPKQELTLRIPGTDVQILMKLIPAGAFNMGSPNDEVDRYLNEGPRHLVTISEPYYVGVYEVTQEQWDAVMGTNPSGSVASGNPVEKVSWNDCQDFITELNRKGIGTFRLPTEAEWEYACRAETQTRYFYGDDPDCLDIGDYAWYMDNSEGATHTVGQKESNAWGLYDMNGNVWEWCSDWYDYYNSASQVDPTGPSTGTGRVIRGGGCFSNPQQCRSARRSDFLPTDSDSVLGFRLVRTAP